jgi:hypothetical protein
MYYFQITLEKQTAKKHKILNIKSLLRAPD